MSPENRELVGSQIMRYSESKGQKIGVVCEIIELITTIIMLRIKVNLAKIREGCCVAYIIVWNNNYLR